MASKRAINLLACTSLCSQILSLCLPCVEEYVEQRASAVRSGIRKSGRCKRASLPVAVVESSSKCDVDNAGAKVLPDGTQWVKVLLEQVRPGYAVSHRRSVLACRAAAGATAGLWSAGPVRKSVQGTGLARPAWVDLLRAEHG